MTVRLDTSQIRQLSQTLEHLIAQKTKHQHGTIGNQTLVDGYPFHLLDVQNKLKLAFIVIKGSASPTRHSEYVTSSAFGYSLDRKPVVLISLNSSTTAHHLHHSATHGGGLVALQLYRALVHELTHAADWLSHSASPAHLPSYYNHPAEVRAYLRDILEEINLSHFALMQKRLRINPGTALLRLLERSETWRSVSPYWSPKNQQKVITSIAKEIERQSTK